MFNKGRWVCGGVYQKYNQNIHHLNTFFSSNSFISSFRVHSDLGNAAFVVGLNGASQVSDLNSIIQYTSTYIKVMHINSFVCEHVQNTVHTQLPFSICLNFFPIKDTIFLYYMGFLPNWNLQWTSLATRHLGLCKST